MMIIHRVSNYGMSNRSFCGVSQPYIVTRLNKYITCKKCLARVTRDKIVDGRSPW